MLVPIVLVHLFKKGVDDEMPKKKLTEGEQPEQKQKKRRRTSVTVGHKMIEKDGKKVRVPVRVYPSGKTKTALQERVKEAKRIHGAGGPGEMADVLFADYALKWLDGIEGQVSQNTAIAYRSRVKELLIPCIGKMQVQSILKSDIQGMIAKLKKKVSRRTGKPISVGTLKAAIANLKQIMNMAVDDRIRGDNPAQRITIKADLEPKRRALTSAETQAALRLIS
jgi:hypothetical protein